MLPGAFQAPSVISPATYVIEGVPRALIDGSDLVALWPLAWPALLIGAISIPVACGCSWLRSGTRNGPAGRSAAGRGYSAHPRTGRS